MHETETRLPSLAPIGHGYVGERRRRYFISLLCVLIYLGLVLTQSGNQPELYSALRIFHESSTISVALDAE